jgi:hypothetical protein
VVPLILTLIVLFLLVDLIDKISCYAGAIIVTVPEPPWKYKAPP